MGTCPPDDILGLIHVGAASTVCRRLSSFRFSFCWSAPKHPRGTETIMPKANAPTQGPQMGYKTNWLVFSCLQFGSERSDPRPTTRITNPNVYCVFASILKVSAPFQRAKERTRMSHVSVPTIASLCRLEVYEPAKKCERFCTLSNP